MEFQDCEYGEHGLKKDESHCPSALTIQPLGVVLGSAERRKGPQTAINGRIPSWKIHGCSSI